VVLGEAPPLTTAQGNVEVCTAGFSDPVQGVDGKQHRLYHFATSAAGVSELLSCRFSALRDFHITLSPRGLDFPSRYVFRDMNKECNARIRSQELLQYLQMLLNSVDVAMAGQVTMSHMLHQSLSCSPAMAAGLMALGGARQLAEQQRQQAQAARLAEIRRQQIADRDFAQNVNHMGMALTMLFPRQLNFQLRTNMFSWRDSVRVQGPGDLDWFSMLRTSPLFSLGDTEVIANLAGEPMLALHRQFRFMHYEYRLERTGLGMMRIPLCVITRYHQLFAPATYAIQMLTPSFGGNIVCEGRWFEDFALYQNGIPACRISRRVWSFPECYDVCIEPNCDVLLFLGLACAIDHIHHEIEKRR